MIGAGQPTAAVWRASGNGARHQERVPAPTGVGCCACNLFLCLTVTAVLGILLGLTSIGLNVVAIRLKSSSVSSEELRNWNEHYPGIWYGSANVFFFAVALILLDVLSRVWKKEADCPNSRTTAVRSLSGILVFIFGAVLPLAGFAAVVLSIITVVLMLTAGHSIWIDKTLQFYAATLGTCLLLFVVNLTMFCVSCCVLCRAKTDMRPLPATHTVLVTPMPSAATSQGHPPSYTEVLRSSRLIETPQGLSSLQASWLGSVPNTSLLAQSVTPTAPVADGVHYGSGPFVGDGVHYGSGPFVADGVHYGSGPFVAPKRFGEDAHELQEGIADSGPIGETEMATSPPPQYEYATFMCRQNSIYPMHQSIAVSGALQGSM